MHMLNEISGPTALGALGSTTPSPTPTAPPAIGADPAVGSVAVLRWPDEEDRRRQLQTDRVPRLLIVGPDADAPILVDDLEDWMRDPPGPADLVARLSVLAGRGEQARSVPRLDHDGLLWSGRSWVVIPDNQLGVVELILSRSNELVTTAALTAAYVRSGSSGHRASVRTMVNRVVDRFARVGLRLHIVRGKGVLLEVPVH